MERPVTTPVPHAAFRPFVARAGNDTTCPPLSPATSAPSAERPRSASSRTSSLNNRTAVCRRSEESGSKHGGNSLTSSRFANHRRSQRRSRTPLTTDEEPAPPARPVLHRKNVLRPSRERELPSTIHMPVSGTNPYIQNADPATTFTTGHGRRERRRRLDVAEAALPYQPSGLTEMQHPHRMAEPMAACHAATCRGCDLSAPRR